MTRWQIFKDTLHMLVYAKPLYLESFQISNLLIELTYGEHHWVEQEYRPGTYQYLIGTSKAWMPCVYADATRLRRYRHCVACPFELTDDVENGISRYEGYQCT